MFNDFEKQLIIVVNKKTAPYGELLSALISSKDDKYDEEGNPVSNGIVGVKDGSVVAAIWDEKHYLNSKPELGSNVKIIFIGDLKAAKSVKSILTFNNRLLKYGILYGSFGNKGMILVDSKKISKDRKLYESFVSSYYEFISSIGTEYSKEQVIYKKYHIEDYADDRRNDIKKIVNAPIKLWNKLFAGKKAKKRTGNETVAVTQAKIPETSDSVANGIDVANHIIRIAIPYMWPAEVVDVIGQVLIKAKTTKAIMDQQYRYGVFELYVEELAKFMENNL